MKQYEYKTHWGEVSSLPSFQKFLNDEGKSGWELICHDNWTLVFKREIDIKPTEQK